MFHQYKGYKRKTAHIITQCEAAQGLRSRVHDLRPTWFECLIRCRDLSHRPRGGGGGSMLV